MPQGMEYSTWPVLKFASVKMRNRIQEFITFSSYQITKHSVTAIPISISLGRDKIVIWCLVIHVVAVTGRFDSPQLPQFYVMLSSAKLKTGKNYLLLLPPASISDWNISPQWIHFAVSSSSLHALHIVFVSISHCFLQIPLKSSLFLFQYFLALWVPQ